jgi:hypothetical protein
MCKNSATNLALCVDCGALGFVEEFTVQTGHRQKCPHSQLIAVSSLSELTGSFHDHVAFASSKGFKRKLRETYSATEAVVSLRAQLDELLSEALILEAVIARISDLGAQMKATLLDLLKRITLHVGLICLIISGIADSVAEKMQVDFQCSFGFEFSASPTK